MLCVQSSLLTCVLTHRLQKAAATTSTADQRAVRRCVAPDAQHARGVPRKKKFFFFYLGAEATRSTCRSNSVLEEEEEEESAAMQRPTLTYKP